MLNHFAKYLDFNDSPRSPQRRRSFSLASACSAFQPWCICQVALIEVSLGLQTQHLHSSCQHRVFFSKPPSVILWILFIIWPHLLCIRNHQVIPILEPAQLDAPLSKCKRLLPWTDRRENLVSAPLDIVCKTAVLFAMLDSAMDSYQTGIPELF